MATTSEPQARIVTLDIVRGIAVMGILAMNIVAFAMPQAAYQNPKAYGGSEGLDLAVWWFNFVLVDGKMRGLFSLLFGASMLLVIEGAAAKGENPASVHYRRMGWLLIFGLLHFFFVWWGDILYQYALIGMIAFLFRNKPIKALIRWAIGFLLVQWLLMALISFQFFTVAEQAAAPGVSADVLAQWSQMKQGFMPSAAELAKDIAVYDGGYGSIVVHRAGQAGFMITGLIFVGMETLAYMLIGMAALKSGFLTGAWDNRRYLRWMIVAYAISIPLYMLIAAWLAGSGFSVTTVVAANLGATVPIRPVMIVGHAALIILLTRNGGALVERIAAAGRMAFTNYLGTSIIVSTLFYGYGGGLYGDLSRAESYLVVFAMWALMLLWSKLWLDRYRFGPFEWLWRSLARGKVQPMRREAAAI
ncbi:DUF418 domain-containing protein [Allosphingosinicella flava]|uniref:DUF418 domain-containing protein n=1 Tax=Allosphingosinicella flava TaxID=2771430 RepID=A0A7T2GHP1_9SPHN|nr:DUF418 domain-containing protein [Sphingosinicella flava]QPQ54076.1 DUF418 domain-containing protein [Sphingosinicella flava]